MFLRDLFREKAKIIFGGIMVLSFGALALPEAYSSLQGAHTYKVSFKIREGIVAEHGKTIIFTTNDRKKKRVVLSEPVIVSKSNCPLEWGYYQFPSLYRLGDGNLLITWQMKEDHYSAYGKTDSGKNMMLSTDNGETWVDYDNRYNPDEYYYSIKKSNGVCMLITSPGLRIDTNKEGFPKPIYQFDENGTEYSFYQESALPSEFQGIMIKKWRIREGKPQNDSREHVAFRDNGLLRCVNFGYMFIWNGPIKELSNNEVLSCNYQAFHSDTNGELLPGGITFYKLNDKDDSFEYQGEIPYIPDSRIDPMGKYRKARGFSEPTFIELKDGRLLCVTRSTFEAELTPMYKSYSDDEGKTWTKPVAFTPNGVDPSLIRLGNGTLVLASGRPGVQLRFCFDEEGENWTEAIEMIPYPIENGKIVTFGGTCGYTALLPYDNDSFYIAYSVFDKESFDGKYFKSIIFRKVTVKN